MKADIQPNSPLKRCVGWFLLANLFVYVLYHLYFIFSTDLSLPLWLHDVLLYAHLLLGRALEIFFPVLTVSAALFAFESKGPLGSLGALSALGLTRVVYYLPYFYIEFIKEGLDTADAIPYSIVFTLLMYAITVLYSGLLTLVCVLLKRARLRKEKNQKQRKSPSPSQWVNGAIIIQFIVFLVREIVYTVSFFREVGLGYDAGEIIFIMAEYLVILLTTLLAYLASRRFFERNKL